MNYKLWLLALVLWAGAAFGQEGVLSGKVTGPGGEGVPGANVVLEGNALPGGKTGTVTDGEGRFRLERLPVGALAETDGNITQAAKLPGINRTKIYRKLAQVDAVGD